MIPRTSLIDLIGLEKLQELQERFYKATGFPNSFVDFEGNYVSKAGEAAHICMNIIREAEEGNRRCVANYIRLTETVEAKSQGPRIYKCHAGIWNVSVPIISDGEHLGFIFIGQCLTESPNKTEATVYAKELGIDPDLYWENYKALPLIPYEMIEQAANLLFFMAAALAEEASGKIKARLEIDRLEVIEKALRESEERIQHLYEEAPLPYQSLDANGCFIDVNKAWLDMMGYTRDQVIGRWMGDFLAPHEVDAYKQRFPRFIETGEVHVDLEIVQHGGSTSIVHIDGRIGYDERGQFKQTHCILRDITESKQAEEALRKSEEKYRILIESLQEGIWVIDKDNVTTFVNLPMADMLGYTVEEMLGRHLFSFMDERGVNIAKQLLERRRQGVKEQHEFEFIKKDGTRIYVLIETTSLTDEDGNYRGAVAGVINITEHKQAEEALRKSESKLSAMLASIGDHMSMMDKDLNILWTNEIAEKIFGNDIIGKKCYEVYHKRTESCEPYPCITLRAFQDGKINEHDTQVIDKDGKTIFFHCTANVALRDKEGKPISVLEISRDITENVRAENALQKAKDELEYRVKERTKDLEIKTNSLEEVNTAMKVLLKKREEDKEELEDNVLTNVKELIAPFFEKIKKTKLDDQQRAFLSIIESNLNEIISPFTRKMSLEYLNLTPTEIQIANLIKHGSPSKQIAELMNVSPRTIDTHRKNIRRKIGLQGQRGNLRSHLLSLH